MGTLGCINDMLQRDKENRELRKLGRERLYEKRKCILNSGKKTQLPNLSLAEFEEIRSNIQEKEDADKNAFLKTILLFGCIGLLIFALIKLTLHY